MGSLREYCYQAGLTPAQAAHYTGKTDRQWRRYQSGAAPIPGHVLKLLELKNGHLGRIHSAWHGWQLNPRSGDLIDPYGRTYSHTWHESLHWHFEKMRATRSRHRQRIDELEKENAQLRAREEMHYSQGEIKTG